MRQEEKDKERNGGAGREVREGRKAGRGSKGKVMTPEGSHCE